MYIYFKVYRLQRNKSFYVNKIKLYFINSLPFLIKYPWCSSDLLTELWSVGWQTYLHDTRFIKICRRIRNQIENVDHDRRGRLLLGNRDGKATILHDGLPRPCLWELQYHWKTGSSQCGKASSDLCESLLNYWHRGWVLKRLFALA